MNPSNFFQAVDEIAARFARLLGVGAALGILSASEGKVWEQVLRRAGIEILGLDSLFRTATIIALMIFAFIQGLGVSALVGEKIGYMLSGSRGLVKYCVILVAIPIIVISSVAISEVNNFAMSVFEK